MAVTDIRPAEFPWLRYEGYTFSLGLTDGESGWLSGHSASGYDAEAGRVLVVGEMAEQAQTAYAKVERILEAAGFGWGDVVRVVENVTAEGVDAYAAARETREEVLGGHRPVVTTVIVDALLRPAALIEVEITAARGGGRLLGGGREAGCERTGARAGGDDVVYLPTILPIDRHGEVVHPGDLPAQYAHCLERAARQLDLAGLPVSQIVKTVDYTTPATLAEHACCAAPRRAVLGPPWPAATSVAMRRLHAPDVLVALDVVASLAAPEPIDPGWRRPAPVTHSPAVRAGRLLHLSGMAALDPEAGEVVHPGDVAAQSAHVYALLADVLGAAGAGVEHLIKTIEYVTPDGLAGYRDVAGVRREALRAPWPASTGVVCHSLLRPGLLLGVDALALLP